MSNGQPHTPESGNVIPFRSREQLNLSYSTLLEKARTEGGNPCLAIFYANQKRWGFYGTGEAVLARLRAISPKEDFVAVSFEKLSPTFVDPAARDTHIPRLAVEEMIENVTQPFAAKPLKVYFANEEGPEYIYEDEVPPVELES